MTRYRILVLSVFLLIIHLTVHRAVAEEVIGEKQRKRTNTSNNRPSINPDEVKRIDDIEYIRLKQKFQNGSLPNRVGLELVCDKFPEPIPDEYYSSLSDEKRKEFVEEGKKRVKACLENLPQNSFLLKSSTEFCGGTDCLISGYATEAGLDLIYADKALSLWEITANTSRGPSTKPVHDSLHQQTKFHDNPPEDLQTILQQIQANLPSPEDISPSGHYKQNENNKLNNDELELTEQKFKESQDRKIQVEVECENSILSQSLNKKTNQSYEATSKIAAQIYFDIPNNEADQRSITLKSTNEGECSFLIRVIRIGLDSLLHDKRVNTIKLLEGKTFDKKGFTH